MRFTDFSGRGAAVRSLLTAYRVGAPPHAALLFGPPGVGKRSLAALLARSLHCAGDEKPCGVCGGCRRYLAGSHPDAYRIPAQKSVGVDEVRALIAKLHAAPYEGGFRTVIVEEAGAMTPQAQNCLLKTLEEPPAKTCFLLTATSLPQLLPTIRSRCALVRVPPMSTDAVAEALVQNGVDAARAAELAALSNGSVGEALAMHGDEAFWALRDKLHGTMRAVRGPSDVLTAVNALRDDKELSARVLTLIEAETRAALWARLNGQQGGGGAWSEILRTAGPGALTAMLERVALSRRMLAANVPWQAVIERFLLDYAEECQAWQS